MASGDTSLTICSDSLLMLGASPISSFNDGSTAATVADRLYGNIRTSLLVAYPWSFTLKKVQLARSVDVPTNEWLYDYPLPSDRIAAPRAVFNSGSTGVETVTRYELFGSSLFTDEQTVYIDYQHDPGEAAYPAYFVQLLKYYLCWHFAEPVTDQIQKGAYWQSVAEGQPSENGRGGYFRKAVNIDGQAQTTQAFTDFPLVSVRG
jgi:hypothetical protein